MSKLNAAPNVEQLKKQAKDLLRAFRAQEPQTAVRIRQHHPEFTAVPIERLTTLPLQLSDTQLVVAREYGFESWPRLKAEVDRISGEKPALKPHAVRREGGRVWVDNIPNIGWGRNRENTFCGALEAALSIAEYPYSYTDLMSLSGLAFRTRWFQGTESPDCCPSSPVGEFPAEIQAITRATGWPMWTGNRLGEDEDKSMSPYWPEIVSSIDDGRPVLAYNMAMDVGVIHGYAEDGHRIIGWDYHHNGDLPFDLPIEKMGPWIAFLDANEGAPELSIAFAESLRATVASFRRETPDSQGARGAYRFGKDALSSWGADLCSADESQRDYYSKLFFVSWWVLNSLMDARSAAVTYLREHANTIDGTADALREAADLYESEAVLLRRTFTERDVFLGPWTGKSIADWTPEVRAKEREFLEAASEIEERAVLSLETALGLSES